MIPRSLPFRRWLSAAPPRVRVRGMLLLAALLAAVLLAGCDDKPAEAPAEGGPGAATVAGAAGPWKVASSFSSTVPILGATGSQVAERLKLLSGGRIALQVFEPGQLVPPLEVFDAVGQGTVDAGLSVPASWYDRMPAVSFFASPPFGADTVEFLAWLYEGRGLELWRELYGRANVVPIPCGYLPPEAAGWFREPIVGAQGFKGKRVHLFGLGGQVLQRLGAQVLVLAAEDLYPALERGVLDGAQVSVPSIDEKMGFARVAKHYYFPGWHQQASVVELLVSRARWEALADADRVLIEVVCRDALVTALTRGEAQQGRVVADLKRQGVEIHLWSDEQLQVLRNAYDEVLKEMRIKDEDFKRVEEAYRRFRADYAEWGQLSRLSRGF